MSGPTYYNYFRDYDPLAGRYVESDLIGLAGGINTYAYANGRPVEYVDPFGLCATCIAMMGGTSYAASWGAGGAVVGGAIAAGASTAADVATGGANIVLQPHEIIGGTVIGGVIGTGLGSMADWLRDALQDQSWNAGDVWIAATGSAKRASRAAASIIARAQGKTDPDPNDDECDRNYKRDMDRCDGVPWEGGEQRRCKVKAAIDYGDCVKNKKNCR